MYSTYKLNKQGDNIQPFPIWNQFVVPCPVQEPTVRTGHGTIDWFQIGKGVHHGCILSPCLFNLYASFKMPGWMKHKLE